MNSRKPVFRHPGLPKNDLGYTRSDYEGLDSTLCAGCGHDSVTNGIIQACFELSIEPHRVAKLSGIGCSSKTPAYFLNKSHGFNSVHGRMPSIATGANMANKDLLYIGVSGDGDTASIGMGQFVHLVRRNLNMVYIVMNNGCYGLTKGQDSATADKGSASKKGRPNPFEAIDARLSNIENLLLKLQHNPQKETKYDLPLGVNAVCELTGKSRPTIYRYVSEKAIPAHKQGGRLYFFKSEILEWIKNH